ncbi:hypothetical protein ACOMHN_014251 [Nucella lapillus]
MEEQKEVVKKSTQITDWTPPEELEQELGELRGAGAWTLGPTCDLMKRVYFYRKSGMHVLTNMRFAKSTMKKRISDARQSNAKKTYTELSSTSSEMRLKEILYAICRQMREVSLEFHDAAPFVTRAMNDINMSVGDMDAEQQLWTLRQLEYHAAFLLAYSTQTLDQFEYMLATLICSYFRGPEIIQLQGMENYLLESRLEQRAQYSNTPCYKTEEMKTLTKRKEMLC